MDVADGKPGLLARRLNGSSAPSAQPSTGGEIAKGAASTVRGNRRRRTGRASCQRRRPDGHQYSARPVPRLRGRPPPRRRRGTGRLHQTALLRP
jgi:hypothetical protein